jgi:hypothetical protein
MVTFSDLEEVLVMEPNTVTVPPPFTVVGVTPNEICAAGPVVGARAATDNRLRMASAANPLFENLVIRKISSRISHDTNRPNGTTGLGYLVQAA